jgi:S1-C subfamily serine protease
MIRSLLRLAATACLLTAGAVGLHASEFLGPLHFDLPPNWGQVPRFEETRKPEAGSQPEDNSLSPTSALRSSRRAIPVFRAAGNGADAPIMLVTWREGQMGMVMGYNMTSHAEGSLTMLGLRLLDPRPIGPSRTMPDSEQRLQIPPSDNGAPNPEQVTVNFTRVRGLTNLSGLLIDIHYYPVPAKQWEMASLVLYAPSHREGAAEMRSLLDGLTVHGKEVGRAIQTHESWKSYFEAVSEGRELAPAVSESNATPAVASTTSARSSASTAPQMGNLVQLHQNSLVLFEGKLGAGSGFVVKTASTDMIISNAHVVAADQGLKLRSMHGTDLKPGPAEVAVDHDILRFRMPEGTPRFGTLEVMENFAEQVRVGDAVAVLGNSEGAGVVRALEGKVVGIGPDRVEIDAMFIPGNSGSPVIHVPSGKVIGVATYIMVHDTSFDSGSSGARRSFRRFAYRMDSVKEWQPVNWPVFYKQSAELNRCKELTENMYMLMKDISSGNGIDAGKHKDPALRNSVAEVLRLSESSERVNEADLKSAIGRLFSNLKSICRTEVGPPTAKGYYDYYWDEFQKQKEIREKMVEGFDSVLRRVDRF